MTATLLVAKNKGLTGVVGAVLGISLLFATALLFGQSYVWYPTPVDVWEPPFNDELERIQKEYVPLDAAQKSWRICVLIPHLKDAYWIGVNYGLVAEARRLGVSLSIFEAGGYENLDVQRRQIQECLASGFDGFLISGVTVDGLNDLIEEIDRRGLPVLDLINGNSSPRITARVAGSYWELGHRTGLYLGRLQKQGDRPIRVAWFPGPSGAGWVAAGDAGFRKAVQDYDIEIVVSANGDTGHAAQGALIRDALERDGPQLDFIVGTAVTAEAAVGIVRRKGLADTIGVLAYYYSPGVHRSIRRGEVIAAPSDLPALTARIALDVMVRKLEGRHYFRHVAPQIDVIDRHNLRDWDSFKAIAPRGFRPTFSVN